MRFWKRILPFLLVNIVLSAATTLAVLAIWDRNRPATPAISTGGVPEAPLPGLAGEGNPNPVFNPDATLPPLDVPVIIIETVIGAGDLQSEAVVLKRTGEGELLLTGWKLTNERGAEFTFPNLVLNRNGSVRLYSRSGTDSVIELFWGRGESAWRSSDTVSLYDTQGNLRASYTIP